MPLPIEQHSATITKKIVGKFVEDIPVRSGFDGFFPSETTPTLMVDVEVERDNDLIAVDVKRFAEGNKNKFTRSSQHTYVPPFFKEDYDFSRDEVYMNTVALGVTSTNAVNQTIAQNALKNVRKNKKKIQRAIRKQQTDVLQTGIVTLKNGDSIDFRRKAGSMVDVGAGADLYWNEAGSKPSEDLGKAMTFLRNIGNSSGTTINVIMRTDAMNALLANASMVEILNSRRMDRAKIDMPQFNDATGMAFHGQMSAGDFAVNLWTYNEKYTDESGNNVYYLERENVIVLPSDFQGKTVFGGLPYMRKVMINGVESRIPGVIEMDFLLRAYNDEKTISSTLELTSAPLVVPFTIDKVYTMKVLADL
jgi:hypothetical protein